MHIEKTSTCSFATSLEIVYKVCDTKRGKDRREINYFNNKINKINQMEVNIQQEIQKLHSLKFKRNNKVRFIE